MSRARMGRLLFGLWLLAGCAERAAAQDGVAPFYKGKTITIVVASSPGGGYDLYGRMIARHIGKHIPGNPSVVVNNMPGAASNVAAAYIYNVGPKDGTVIGALFMGAIVDPLFGNRPRTTHDMSRFNYIGNANKDVYVCLIRSDAPVKNFAEALEKELIVGGTAEGASTRDFPELLKSLLGAKFKIVSGYPGSTQVNLAMERGEVQGGCGQSWSSVSATRAAAFKDGTIKVLAQEDTEGYPALNKQGVPLTRDFATTDEQRRILDLVYSQTVFGRPYVVAQEVPKERVAALRQAFMAAIRDPELRAEAERIQVDIDAIGGDELQTAIAKIYTTPPDILEKARQAMAAK
jgi:tripartite-type tricarboxylate transporter receptor subunit TctC